MNEAPKPTIQNQSGGNNICDGENAILVTNAIGDALTFGKMRTVILSEISKHFTLQKQELTK